METILIVDDIQENIYLLNVLLKNSGYKVLEARNGKEALMIAKRARPDLIITDILMPEMDGFELCRVWKNDIQLKSIPLIFYTATYTDTKDEAFALSLGADMFLRKPMKPEQFIVSIEEAVHSVEEHPEPIKKPIIKDEEESYKLYSERLIHKLEKKMLDLEAEIGVRKETEEELRKARNEWEEIFQAIGSPALLLDTEFNILHANRFALDHTGKSEEQLVGTKCYEIMHQKDQPHSNCPMAMLLENSAPNYVEAEVDSMDGSFLVNCAPLKNEDGEMDKIIHIAVDITGRKKTEERLKESEQRYRRLTDNAKDMIYRMSLPDGVYEFVSPASKELFGYSPEQFYASPVLIRKVIHPDWLGYFENEWNNLIAGKMPPTYEYQVIHKDGETRWMHQRNTLVLNDHNEPCAIEGIVTDITQRKMMEMALEDSEEKFRQLVENIHEIFWIRDAKDQSILYISTMFEKIFNISTESMYSDPYAFMKVILEEDREIILGAHKDQMEKGIQTDITFRIEVDEQIRWIRSRAFPVRDENGTVSWIAGVAEDISSLYQAEMERKKLEAQLIHSHKIEAIGTLAGGIAHDFNNILSSIIGFTELAIDEIAPGGTAHEYVNEVLIAGMRAKELVRQILTLAQKSDDEIKPVNVGKIAIEALKLIRASTPANIDIHANIRSESLVYAPPAQIHQVVMNLMTNAAAAVERDGGTIDISINDIVLRHSPVPGSSGFRAGEYIRIKISDTGVGISRKDIGHIFDPYFTTKEVGSGTGLGLSITHGIIQKCGGLITVDSKVGKGTAFIVFLPVTERQHQLHEQDKDIPTGSERILVVDDEPKIVDVLVKRLNQLGYSVAASTSSAEALALFEEKHSEIDLVITDMTMPRVTGDKLAAELTSIKPGIPIILCTGYSKRMSEESAAESGIKAFLMKPVSTVELAQQVRKLLDDT